MSILLFSISSTSVPSKPRTNSDSNDGHTTSPLSSPHTTPPLVSGHRPPLSLRSPGTAERGSQPVRQPCSPHRFRESGRQPCILTSLALTSSGGMRLSLEDGGNRGEKPHEGVSSCRDAMMQLRMVVVPKCPLWCISGPWLSLILLPVWMLHRCSHHKEKSGFWGLALSAGEMNLVPIQVYLYSNFQ